MKDNGDFNKALAQAERHACHTATFNVIQTALIHNTTIAVGKSGEVIHLEPKTQTSHYVPSLKSISKS